MPVKQTDQADRPTGKLSNHHKWLESHKIWSVEELETLPEGHKAKDTTQSITQGRKAWKEKALNDHPWKDERESHRQSCKHWNYFQGDAKETSETRGGKHTGFPKHTDTIFS